MEVRQGRWHAKSASSMAGRGHTLERKLAADRSSAARSSPTAETRVLRDYLDEKINLGKAAELLQLSRFDLEESSGDWGVRSVEEPAPLRIQA